MKPDTIRIHLVGVSDNDGALLTSIFRRRGLIARFSRSDDAGHLVQTLAEGEIDLLLVDSERSPVDLHGCLTHLRQAGADIPLLVLSESERGEDFGDIHYDVTPPGDNERLARSCILHYQALKTRRELHDVAIKLREAEQRNALLLSQSEEAIAYVADGMIISANEHFARRFGYTEPDELDCLPLVDLVGKSDQDRLKNALKAQVAGADKARLAVTARLRDGSELALDLHLQYAVYDGDSCVQLTLAEGGEAAAASASAIDALTRMSTSDVFREQLQDVARHGLGGGKEGALLLVSVDRYAQLRRRLGLAKAERIVGDAAQLTREKFESALFGRVGDDILACLLLDCGASKALEQATALCRLAEKRTVDFGESSQHYTVSVGVLPIGDRSLPDAVQVLDQTFQVCEQIRDEAANNGIGNAAALFVRERQRLSRDLDAARLLEEARLDERLVLLFQPLVSLAEDEGNHYEVRLDLKERENDEISGMELLGMLEEQGGDTELDRWIIMEATKRLAEKLKGTPDLRLLINLSCNVFQDEGFIPWLGVALKAGRIPAEALLFEFSAGSVSSALKPARKFAEQLRALGCGLAVREVTAHAEHLQILKLLKPQFAFVADGSGGKGKKKLSNDELKSVLKNIREQEVRAVVSGVDSASTLATLWQIRPDYIQGSYVQDPGTEMDYEFAAMG